MNLEIFFYFNIPKSLECWRNGIYLHTERRRNGLSVMIREHSATFRDYEKVSIEIP